MNQKQINEKDFSYVFLDIPLLRTASSVFPIISSNLKKEKIFKRPEIKIMFSNESIFRKNMLNILFSGCFLPFSTKNNNDK